MRVMSGRAVLSTVEIARVAGTDPAYDDHRQLIVLG
jgi:hypothetical protein